MNSQNTEKKNAPHVAVVGAGLAGLVAAYQLVRGGARVTVFEKSHETGGRAKTTVKEGFHLNLGPHALYKGGAAFKFLTSINAVPSGKEPPQDGAIALYDGKTFDLPFAPEPQLQNPLLSSDEQLELVQWMQNVINTDLTQLDSVTLGDWLDGNIKNDRVKDVIAGLIRLASYGNNKPQMSTGAAFKQFLLAQQGVLYLDNGWTKIVEILFSALKSSVTFHFESAISSIAFGNGTGTVSVTANGITHKFDDVILCVPPQAVEKILPNAIPTEKFSQIVPTKAACLDICLRKLPKPNVTFAIGMDEPLYYSVHTRAAQLAPDNGAMIHLAVYLGPNESSKVHEERLLKLMDQLQPGWQNELVYKRFLLSMVASNGTPLAVLNGASGLESPIVDGYPNVYVTGDFVGKGALLVDAAVKSALEAVEIVLGKTSAGSVEKTNLAASF